MGLREKLLFELQSLPAVPPSVSGYKTNVASLPHLEVLFRMFLSAAAKPSAFLVLVKNFWWSGRVTIPNHPTVQGLVPIPIAAPLVGRCGLVGGRGNAPLGNFRYVLRRWFYRPLTGMPPIFIKSFLK